MRVNLLKSNCSALFSCLFPLFFHFCSSPPIFTLITLRLVVLAVRKCFIYPLNFRKIFLSATAAETVFSLYLSHLDLPVQFSTLSRPTSLSLILSISRSLFPRHSRCRRATSDYKSRTGIRPTGIVRTATERLLPRARIPGGAVRPEPCPVTNGSRKATSG